MSYPLSGMEHAQACVWNEMEYDKRRMPWGSMLQWLEGSMFKIGKPKNISRADVQFRAVGQPVVMTGPHKLRHPTDRVQEEMMQQGIVQFGRTN